MKSPSSSTPTLDQIEAQLQQRVNHYPPTPWGRKQSNSWDRQTRFIYAIYRWDELQARVSRLDEAMRAYAINRWFNFWSARAVEEIFGDLPGVEPNRNRQDRLVDFSIQGIKFDHKTSVFPKNYERSAKFAWYHKAHLIHWLYRRQSQEQRYHTANRLFIILYDARHGEHWQLRADVSGLRRVILRYVSRFEPSKLVTLDFGERPNARRPALVC